MTAVVRRRPRPVSWLAGAVVLGATVLLGALARAGSPGPSEQPAGTVRVTAQVTIQHRGPSRPSLVFVRLDPPAAAGGGELLLSIFKRGGVTNRHVLQPIGLGVYRAEYVFPSGGTWGYYMRFGTGQAGFVSAGVVDITADGGKADTFTGVFHGRLGRAPGFVLPLGYAAFGLIAALALASVSWILVWLRSAAR